MQVLNLKNVKKTENLVLELRLVGNLVSWSGQKFKVLAEIVWNSKNLVLVLVTSWNSCIKLSFFSA